MGVGVHPIVLGFDHCYLVRGEGAVLIDAGAPNKNKDFQKAIGRLSIRPQDIRLIVITHGHWDHVGSAKEIKAITGAKLAMHHEEKEWLEKAVKLMPPGATPWGRMTAKIGTWLLPLVNFPATKVDLVLGDEDLSLTEYGIPGEILHTPGHSKGSVSVLLETGEAFVGDLAMNKLPLRFRPGLPIYADDMGKVKESWKLLLKRGAKTVYPAHGKPFPAEIMRRSVS